MTGPDNLQKNRMYGITVRELGRSQNYDPLVSLNCLKSEASSSNLDRKNVIKKFDYNSENDECYISAIIDVPMKIKELKNEEGDFKFIERLVNFPRDIEVIIRLGKSVVIFFSRSQREVQRFSKYLKQISLGGFRPYPIEFDQNKLRYFLRDFNSINHLKILDNSNHVVTTYNGQDLLSKKQIADHLSNSAISIYEIGGEFEFNSGATYNFYINYKGRAIFKGENELPDQYIPNDFLNIIENMKDKLK